MAEVTPRMDDRLSELSNRVKFLEKRITALEATVGSSLQEAATETAPDARTESPMENVAAAGSATDAPRPRLPAVGRTLLILAGAFLLKARIPITWNCF